MKKHAGRKSDRGEVENDAGLCRDDVNGDQEMKVVDAYSYLHVDECD